VQFTNRPLRDEVGRTPIQSFALMTQIGCDFIGPSTALLIVLNNTEIEILAVILITLFLPYEIKMPLQQKGPLLRHLREVTVV